MVLVILGLLLISSVCSNWLYYSFCALTWDQFGEVKGDYSRYVSKKIEGYFNELFANMFTYGFKVTSVLTGIIKLILFSVMIVVSEEKLSIKLGLFGLVGISLLGIILFGWKFYKSSWKLRERLVAHRQPVSRDLAVRVVTPALYNVYLAGVLPISLVLLTHFGLASTITLIALLFSLLGMFWDFVQNAEGAMVTKKMVKGINKYLGKLTNKYVLTDEGYRRMASLTQPKKAILKRSKENKSLVLDNLILKYITNGGNTRRKFSIEIKPGLYQLCGENGIGKTTLLETLTLTNEELVELASGGAAFAGEPLFDFESDLSKHRARYTYIGKYTKQRAVDGALMKKLTNYPIISNFLKKLMLSKKGSIRREKRLFRQYVLIYLREEGRQFLWLMSCYQRYTMITRCQFATR